MLAVASVAFPVAHGFVFCCWCHACRSKQAFSCSSRIFPVTGAIYALAGGAIPVAPGSVFVAGIMLAIAGQTVPVAPGSFL